jgi:hypothetical protein
MSKPKASAEAGSSCVSIAILDKLLRSSVGSRACSAFHKNLISTKKSPGLGIRVATSLV